MADKLRGRFVWHELMASDPKSATPFYAKVVGWKPQAYDKDPSYTLMMTNKRPMAGAMALPEQAKSMGTPPNWLTYIGTSNVDATARQAAELGAKVLRQPSDIPEIGRFAVIQDPQGAVFAAFTPKGAPPTDAKPGLGDFSWHELITTDWPKAFDFYQELFGWEKTESMEMGPGSTYQMYGWKGSTLGGMFNKPAEMPGPPMWLPYALVPDSKRAAETVKTLGGKIINGPMEVPGGDWIAQGIDPQGAMFAVHSRKKAVPKPSAARRRAKPAKPAKPAKKSAKKARPAKKAKSRKAKRGRRR